MRNFKTSKPDQVVEQGKFACFHNNALSNSQAHTVKGGDDTELPTDNPAPPIIIEDIVDI